MISRYFFILFLFFGNLCFADKIGQDEETLTIPVVLENLYAEKQNLFVNIEGQTHPVKALHLSENNNWLAQIHLENTNGYRYCRKLHRLCAQCDQCHTEGCPFFVKYCSLWK